MRNLGFRIRRARNSMFVRVLIAAFALGCLGLCAVPTRADTVTLAASGLLVQFPELSPPNDACIIALPTPNLCYLGGTITIDNFTGAILSSDITASGFPMTIQPFTQVGVVGTFDGETYLSVRNSQDEGVTFSFEQTPVLGSLVGFDGSVINNDLSGAGIDGLDLLIFGGSLDVVAVTAPETPLILLLITGLLAVAAVEKLTYRSR
jgi:hypothetical protein